MLNVSFFSFRKYKPSECSIKSTKETDKCPHCIAYNNTKEILNGFLAQIPILNLQMVQKKLQHRIKERKKNILYDLLDEDDRT